MTQRAAILAAALVVAASTLYPARGGRDPAFEFCVLCGELGTLDFVLNVALFVPLGAAVAWRSAGRSQVARAAGVAAVLSLVVELCQLVLVRGRDPSLGDLLANTTGGALGGAAVAFLPRLVRASAGTWLRVTALWTLGSAALLVFGAWAVRMHVPNDTYYVQWLPKRQGYSIFPGRLSNLALDGRRLTYGEVLPPQSLPARFFAGDFSLTGEIIPGERPEHLALIARLALPAAEFFMIGRQGDALVVRYRANASRIGLRSPVYAMGEVFAEEPLMTLHVETATRHDEVHMRLTGPQGARTRIDRVSGARLWATLLPLDLGFASLGTLGDMLWLAILFAPAAYGGARASRGAARLALALALAAVVALLALTYQHTLWWWPLWVAIAAAIGGGYWSGSRSSRVAAAGAASP